MFCAHRVTRVRESWSYAEIEKNLLRRILKEGYEMGLRRVGLYTIGEMFLCNDVLYHIQNAKEIGYTYIYSDTNGALATKERLASVIESGLDSLKFSINAGKRHTYKIIHGSDDFDKVIENLRACHELKLKLNPKFKIMVSFIATKQTEDEVELLKEIVSPYVDQIVVRPVRAFFQQYDDNFTHMSTETFGGSTKRAKIPCAMVLNRVHVTSEGYLSACCIDFKRDLLLADLKTMSLSDAWLSENAVNFRKRHLEKQVEGTMCFGCSVGKYIPYDPLEI